MRRRELLLALSALVLVVAASLSLHRAFIDATWVNVTWAAVVLAIVIAATARRVGLGAVGSAVASGAVWIVFTYVVHLDAGGLLPGAEQFAQFTDLWSQAVTDLMQEPAPARTLPSLLLVTSAAGWWVSHVAHELLVRARRPGPAILAAAVLWVFPLAVPQPPGRTWPQALPFLAAAGMLLLVEPDPDLSSWRRPSGQVTAPGPAGIGVGVVALLLALTLPGVLPGYGQEPWVDLSGADAARGYQPIVDVSRRLKLPAERDLLRVRSDVPVYLRLAGLDTFDGGTWRLGPADQASFEPDQVIPADRRLPPEVPTEQTLTTTVEIENLSLENVFVPTPYRPVQVQGSAARRMVYSEDGTFIATSDTLEGEPALIPGLSYAVDVELPDPDAAALQQVPFEAYQRPEYQRWMQLPTDYTRLAELGDRIAADAGAGSPYEVAFALQEHFRDRGAFTYSTDVPALRGSDALQRFVIDDRIGYCEYFATGMAVMLRQQGIPSRVAVGFRLGDQIGEGEYLVTTADAHAWVEVLFPGYGWIQFEPTPALQDALVPTRDDITPYTPVGFAPGAAPTASEQPQEAPTDLPNQSDLQDVPGGLGAAADDEDAAGAITPRRVLPIVATVLLAIASVALVLSARRRRRHHPDLDEPERTLAAQRRVLHDARTYGVGRHDHETALELSRRWASEGRVEPASAERLARLAQAAAFGGHLPDGAGAEAERLGDRLVEELRGSVPRGARLAAPVRIPYEMTRETGRKVLTAVRDAPRD